MDNRQAKAVMQSLKSTASFLGKESEYLTFEEYVTWSEKAEPKPSLEQIAANTPMWIQLLSPPLRTLYAEGYDTGYEDAISRNR